MVVAISRNALSADIAVGAGRINLLPLIVPPATVTFVALTVHLNVLAPPALL